ncbi:unnamed protein product [Leptidea sinapis]|uniref:Uncharacterized protein n=1 Tax=Leptidea sinapis TaxID=189913 RepID=A0A5E4Q1B4_9NEOP|nr:unnamed protein product [Leptidea sinapis]
MMLANVISESKDGFSYVVLRFDKTVPPDIFNMPHEIKDIKERLPSESPKERRKICKDKEARRECQVQGEMLSFPVHTGHHRQGEGREA